MLAASWSWEAAVQVKGKSIGSRGCSCSSRVVTVRQSVDFTPRKRCRCQRTPVSWFSWRETNPKPKKDYCMKPIKPLAILATVTIGLALALTACDKAVETVKEKADEAKKVVETKAEEAKAATVKKIDEAKEAAKEAVPAAAAALDQMADTAKEATQGAVEKTKDAADKAVDKVEDAATDAMHSAASEMAPAVSPASTPAAPKP